MTSTTAALAMSPTVTIDHRGAHQHAHTSMEHLLSVSRIVLLQAVEMLDNQVQTDSLISTQSKLIPGSTIGLLAVSMRVGLLVFKHNFCCR
jgi:hypothetical protein